MFSLRGLGVQIDLFYALCSCSEVSGLKVQSLFYLHNVCCLLHGISQGLAFKKTNQIKTNQNKPCMIEISCWGTIFFATKMWKSLHLFTNQMRREIQWTWIEIWASSSCVVINHCARQSELIIYTTYCMWQEVRNFGEDTIVSNKCQQSNTKWGNMGKSEKVPLDTHVLWRHGPDKLSEPITALACESNNNVSKIII